MVSTALRILNFDDSLIRQKRFLEKFSPAIVDLRAAGPAARLWLDRKTAQDIRDALSPEFKKSITLLGSGDFHHISALLIEQFQQPISVIVFDNHPDWEILPPQLGCGSWVSRILKRPNILKVILLGVSSHDISTFSIETANLRSLADDHLEIYPYSRRPTRVVLRGVPQNISLQLKKGLFYKSICWRELQNKNLSDFLSQIITRIPTKEVYISIDKDVLQSEYALTNWEEGKMQLDEMLAILRLIKERLDIVGVDIVGDYSRPQVKGRIKAFCSYFDHPKDYTARGRQEDLISSVNAQTNIRITELLKT